MASGYSPFDFSSPFVINDQSTNQMFMSPFTNNNSVMVPTAPIVAPPPTYESVCNGTSRSAPLNNQSTTHQALRNPPPGLVHPTQNQKEIINAALLQALEKELADINQKIVNIGKILTFLKNNQ
jgi:hypothetical protein